MCGSKCPAEITDAVQLKRENLSGAADMAKAIANPIFAGLGAFYSPNDKTRHALVSTTEGKVFEIFYNTKGKGQSYLACFDSITAADAFFTTDDNTSHVIVATPDGSVNEIYYDQSGVFFSAPPLATFASIRAISGFFTSDDNNRHVIVATADGNITEIFYSSKTGSHVSSPPLAKFANIVAISGFFTPDDNFRHVIVATADGNVTEVYYDSKTGSHISQPPLANMANIVDIAAFYTPDDHNRHVIVATADGKITEIFYGSAIGVHISQPPLATLPGVVGIGAFYSDDDGYRHVIVATGGNVTEVFYKSNAPASVSNPPLGIFSVAVPAFDDISPDLGNLDTNATQRVAAGFVGTAGRTLSICGTTNSLFIFNDNAGVWTSTGAPTWTQLPKGPIASSLFPHSEIASDPRTPGHAVAATLAGAFETADGGTTWTLALDPTTESSWNCPTQAIRSVVFSNSSALVLALDCGIAMRASGANTFSLFRTNAQVTALAVSQTKLWARTAGSLFCLPDGSAQWTTLLNNSINLPAPNENDQFSLAAFDNFAYMPSAISGLGGCGDGCMLGIYNVANGTLTSQPVQSLLNGNATQVCDGTGLGGRKFVRAFIRKDTSLPNSVGPGGRQQLFFGSGQEIYQAADIGASGNPSNWKLVIASWESGSKTSSGATPPVTIHADIWDFLIDISVGGNRAWVAGDGGVYQIQLGTPFTFPESAGWTLFFGGMHTHQAHMVSVVPTNPVNRSCVAYPTGDNEAWYQGSSMRVNPAADWEVTNTPEWNLGDVNWTIVDASSSRFMFLVRNQEYAALVDFSNPKSDSRFVSFLDFWKKKNGTALDLVPGHFFPSGPTALQFIPSPKSAGGFLTLDAVMMCDLPLITYDGTTDTNNPMFPTSNPLGQSTNGQPVLIRNHNFEVNADINTSKGAGWAVEVNPMPANVQGFYVTGGRTTPIYYSFTGAGELLKFSGGKWSPVTSGLISSAQFGPAFVNPFDSQVIFAITPASIIWSNNGGTNFNPDSALSELVTGDKNLSMNSLAQIAFNFDNPAEIVAGGAAGIFYRNAGGRWSDLTHLLPTPVSALTGVAIDSEAIYASFDSRSIIRITSYRNS
jgi:hypothetical protein